MGKLQFSGVAISGLPSVPRSLNYFGFMNGVYNYTIIMMLIKFS